MSQSYFVDHKRGEVDEIRTSLQNIKIKDKRDVIKKVIAYMSLGIDMSKLYGEMIMAGSTTDAVQKKMVYQYLCTYAQEKADLAILCINTLQKDCRDQDPMFRGLALRSLCSLRVPNICEYALPCLRQCLKDPSPYVRKTAVLAAVKLHAFMPTEIEESAGDLIDILYDMLRDPDTQVVTNVIVALNEMLKPRNVDDETPMAPHTINEFFEVGAGARAVQSQGGLEVDAKLMLYLFNRLHEFPEWGQCTVLDLACRYVPQSEDELFDIMNLLEDRLKHANSAVMMATTKVFLHLTRALPEIQEDVFRRLQAPLITLVSVSPVEVAYAVLAHIKAIATQVPSVFAPSHRQLFPRNNDPWCVKALKLDVLALIANADNAHAILGELSEAALDRDHELAAAAVQAIGRVAVTASGALEECVCALLEMTRMHADHLTTEVIIACRDILRKHPERCVDIVPQLQQLLQNRDIAELASPQADQSGVSATFAVSLGQHGSASSQALCALVWMLGEFGEDLPEAPYTLENLAKAWAEGTEDAAAVDCDVQMELLAAAAKLFFKRPHEARPALGLSLATALKPTDVAPHVDLAVRDRAAMYVRLLRGDVGAAAKVIGGARTVVDSFWETALAQHKRTDASGASVPFMLREFNTLSVMYNIPESSFKKLTVTLTRVDEPVPEVVEEAEDEVDHHSIPVSSSPANDIDVLGLGAAAEAAPAAATEEDTTGLGLQLQPELDPEMFQELWSALPETSIEFGMEPAHAADSAVVEAALAAQRVYVMAAGECDEGMKYYLYAANLDDMDTSDGNPAVYLLECVIAPTTGAVSATLKTNTDEDHTNAFYNLFGTTLTAI